MQFVTCCAEQTEAVGEALGKVLKPGTVIAYEGDLGAGKTAFTRGLAQGMDLIGEVASPTFSIVNEYLGKINLYHFDMYRVESSDDLETTGFYDYLDSGCLCIMEWPENIAELLPEETLKVYISVNPDQSRTITWED